MPIRVIHTIAELRAALAGSQPVGFVPTMGNLHQGHLDLVKIARPRSKVVVASIFVNRLQFAPHEDFDRYPRTLDADVRALESVGCDLVFAPDERELYPQPQGYKVHPPAEMADILEGHFRPGFFVGVATVVHKLFNIVQPQLAVFGQKDYQQLMVIRNLVQQMALPIEILEGPTTRAEDGLALSSRNGYLDPAARAQAPQLQALLRRMVQQVRAMRLGESGGSVDSEPSPTRSGPADLQALTDIEDAAMRDAQAWGWSPDYFVIRRRHDLQVPAQASDPLVVLAAARLGGVRLIDNREVD